MPTFPVPTFIPAKRKECLSVASWRTVSNSSPEGGDGADDSSFFVKVPLMQQVTTEKIFSLLRGKVRYMDNFVLGPTFSIGKVGGHKDKNISPEATPVPEVSQPSSTALPEMSLPASVTTTAFSTNQVLCLRFTKQTDADGCKKLILQEFQGHECVMEPTLNEQRSPTLLIKGLAFNSRLEQLGEYFKQLRAPPTYVRLQRTDRGVFKGILYIKFPTAVAADIAFQEISRVALGPRPLKTEFKSKKKTKRGESAEPVVDSMVAHLDMLVKDLKNSKENDGFSFQNNVLSKEDLSYLKEICTSLELIFECTDTVTIRKKTSSRSGGPSPALRPQSVTPPFNPATPGSLHPMDPEAGINFRGIRHWRETRQYNPVGARFEILRPKGPGDVPAFGVGRGRPT